MDFEEQVFTGGIVELGGNRYLDCTFGKGVSLHYSGGPVYVVGCTFETSDLVLAGGLLKDLECLGALAKMAGPKGVKQAVDVAARTIRGAPKPG